MATIYQPIRVQGDAFYVRIPKSLIDKKVLSSDGRIYEINLKPIAKDAKESALNEEEQKAEAPQ